MKLKMLADTFFLLQRLDLFSQPDMMIKHRQFFVNDNDDGNDYIHMSTPTYYRTVEVKNGKLEAYQ